MKYTTSNFASQLAITCVVVLTAMTGVQAQSLLLDSQADLSKARRWSVLRSGGWVEVTGGKIDFMSPSGVRQRRLDLRGNEYFFAPPVSSVLGVIAFADRQPKTLSAVSFDLFAPDGEQIVRLNKPQFASAIISPTGSAFVGVDGAKGLPTSVLRFYDAAGKNRDEITVTRFKGAEYTRDGSLVFVESSDSGLTAYAPTGQVVHRYGTADDWAASSDGSVVMLKRGNRLFFYDHGALSQTLGWRSDGAPVRDLALSPEGTRAAIVTTDQAFVIIVASATVLWETETGDPDWNFRSVDLAGEAQLVALGLDYDPGPSSFERHTRSRCLLVSASGELLDSKDDAPSEWGSEFPLVRFDQDSTRVFFINRDRFQTFRIQDLN